MKFLLDTDSISFLFAKSGDYHKKISQKFSLLKDDDIVQVSFMTIFELEYSCSNATDSIKRKEIRDTIENTKQKFEIVPLKIEYSSIYGEVKTKLKNHWGSTTKGMRKHNVDLMIASTAISESSTLIANDEIYKVLMQIHPPFQYQNWTL